MKKLIVYTGLDGCGKSTRVKKLEENEDIKYLYEPTSYRYKSFNELLSIYTSNDINLLDRFFPLDELVYSKVWGESSRLTINELINIFFSEILKVRQLEINIGINTFVEYSLVHEIRKEINFPDYFKSIRGWMELMKKVFSVIQEKFSKEITINFFWYDKTLNYSEFIQFCEGELEHENRK